MRRRGRWTADELETFLASSADTRIEVAWHLLAAAGMRVGEVLALRWADIDASTGRIRIQNAVVGVPYSVIAVPPTDPRARVIAVSPAVIGTLGRHHRRQQAERSEWGEHYDDTDLVVCREDGRPLHPRTLHRAFAREVVAAGLPCIALADVRRSHRPTPWEAAQS